MFIYSVSTKSNGYLVTVENDQNGWTPADDRAIRLFAAGAASMRDGGPVGTAVITDRVEAPNGTHFHVFVGVEHPEGPRN